MPYDTWSVFSLVLAIVSTLLDNCLLLVQVLCSLSFPFSLTTSLSFFFPSCLFHTPPLFFDKISCSGLALSSPWRMTLNSWAFYLHLLCIGVSSVHCHVVSAWQNQLPCGFCSVGCRTQGFLYVGQAYSQPSHLPSWILIFLRVWNKSYFSVFWDLLSLFLHTVNLKKYLLNESMYYNSQKQLSFLRTPSCNPAWLFALGGNLETKNKLNGNYF